MASSTFLHSYSLLLLIILPFLPSVYSATTSNCSANSIHLNSTLVTNHTWNSPSGLFAFGFQNVLSNKEFMSVLAVWFPKDPHRTIVWYAKYKQTSDLGTMHAVSSMQKSLAFPSDSTVKLTNKGIVLYDQNGQEMWHRPKNNSIALVRCASMLDSGNFVLLDETGKHVWESFEEPTDTFLPGQILAKPKSFRARHSNTSFYDGSFELAWQSDYNFVLYYSPQSSVTREAYWATQTNSYDESLLVFNESGHMYIKRSNTGKVIREVLYGGSEEFLYMARIDPDGLFRLYRHRKGENL